MKLALLHSFDKSAWKSCQIISANLISTYKLALKENEVLCFNFNQRMTENEYLELARDLFQAQITHISFIDHKPHLSALIRYLDHFYSQEPKVKRPSIIIHVFGDFTLYGEDWLESEKFLKRFKAKFICASHRQKNLISKFLNEKKEGPYVCPFPVNQESFYYSADIRNVQREKLGLDKDTVAFLYTGRLSLQKKIWELVTDFANFLETTKLNAVLYLAGEFDDLGNPFTGIYTKNGEYALRFRQAYACLNPQAQKRIHYIGNLSQNDLLKHYNAADVFISLSAHNDEDYGMSPAEALCTGLPCILSDWAGYASFNLENKNACTLIPTKIDNNASISYDSKILLKNIFAMMIKTPKLHEMRAELSEMNQAAFSIKGNVSVLSKILKDDAKNFRGFSETMTRLARVFDRPSPPFVEFHKTYNDLYKEVYDSYLPR